jgi:outer membrane protein TolC
MTHPLPRPLGIAIAIAACALSEHPALALQPVTEFVMHAKSWNPKNRAARATTTRRDAEVGVSSGSLLPSLSAGVTYTRNQYEVTTAALLPPSSSAMSPSGIPNIVIQPQDQFDGNVLLLVPLISIANWDRRGAAEAALEGAEADEASTALAVEKGVIRDYYTLLADEAVLLAATKNLDLAEHNVQLARDRKDSGTSSELDVQRALADRAKAEQDVTAAELAVTNTRRDLYSLSGLAAEPASVFPEDDLREEEPLAAFTGKADDVPSVKSAAANRVSAEQAARAAHAAWLPTVSAAAQEKFTNATAFIGGHNAVYLVQVTAAWKLDTTLAPQVRAQNAAAAAARASEEQARQQAEDAVFRDWHQIRADIESARSSRVRVVATNLAASLAEDRYKSGVATQLDVLQARQDAFAADVARIQADADLAYARLALRLDAGKLHTAKETR